MKCAKCGGYESHHFEDGDRADSLGRCDGYVPITAITRDMLLAEIRRSLMATHPDRAEALCAALERELVKPLPAGAPVQIVHPRAANALIERLGQLPRGMMISEPVQTGSPTMTLEEIRDYFASGGQR